MFKKTTKKIIASLIIISSVLVTSTFLYSCNNKSNSVKHVKNAEALITNKSVNNNPIHLSMNDDLSLIDNRVVRVQADIDNFSNSSYGYGRIEI
jgi:archaellum component FlaF (FlaF/FlaG flagellin family)